MSKSRIILFILAFLIWSFLTWPLDLQHLIIGIPVCGLVAFITGDMFVHPVRKKPPNGIGLSNGVKRPHGLGSINRYLWFLYYVPVFIWECIKANLDVAYRVVHPDLPINPGIVKVKTTLKSDTALTFLANTITLTPGTMSVDIDRENGILYIHWINVKDKDIRKATEIIVKTFEDILKRIFE